LKFVYKSKNNKIIKGWKNKHYQFHNFFNNELKLDLENENLEKIGEIIRIVVNFPGTTSLVQKNYTKGLVSTIFINKNNIRKIIKDEKVVDIINKIPVSKIEEKIKKN
jgi:hypothetical protein